MYVLFIFDISSIISITIVGIFIDNYLRKLIILSLSLFVISGLLFYAFDGGATLFQTAN